MNNLMSAMNEENAVLNDLREVFREVISSSMSSFVYEMIKLSLEKRLGSDPFEALWSNPKAFYNALHGFFGSGTDVFLKVLIDGINRKYGLNLSGDEFANLIRSDNKESIAKCRNLLKKISVSYRKRAWREAEESSRREGAWMLREWKLA